MLYRLVASFVIGLSWGLLYTCPQVEARASRCSLRTADKVNTIQPSPAERYLPEAKLSLHRSIPAPPSIPAKKIVIETDLPSVVESKGVFSKTEDNLEPIEADERIRAIEERFEMNVNIEPQNRLSHFRWGFGIMPRILARRHIFLLDWDDTLLPAEVLKIACTVDGRIVVKIHESRIPALAHLEKQIEKLLVVLLSYGDVRIVTNAAEGWIDASAAVAYPNLVTDPRFTRAITFSARGGYQSYSKITSDWKYRAFQAFLKKPLAKGIPLGVFSIGDGPDEREAVIGATFRLKNVLTKVIRINRRLTAEQLAEQLNRIVAYLPSLIRREVGFDSKPEDFAILVGK